MSRHNHHHRRDTVIAIIGGLLVAVQFFASILLIFSLLKLNILQLWQFALVVGILVLIFAYNIFELFFRQRARLFGKIASCVLAALISAGCFYAYSYIQQANDFLAEITAVHEETIVYEVRVFKDSGITDFKQLAGQPIGSLKNSPNIETTKNTLIDQLGSYQDIEYDEIGLMIADLYEKNIPAIVVNESYLSFLEDTDYNLEEDTTKVYEFRVRNPEKADLRTPVSVTKEPFILYISGSDAPSGNINDVSRSDVNILAVINPEKGKILLVNIPRDYYLQLHGTTGTKDKLTHAGLYGINMSKATIEDLLGITINYTFKIGFNGVEKFVDAIDGVDIYSPGETKLTTRTGKVCRIHWQWNHLDGACALRYARERKSFANGDLDRAKHQQDVITAIINKVSDLHYLTRYSQILDAAKGTFQTSFTSDEISDFVRWQLAELKHWQIESIQIEGTASQQPTYSLGSTKLFVFLPNEEDEKAAKEKIAEYLTK